jgi:hypothetical protein
VGALGTTGWDEKLGISGRLEADLEKEKFNAEEPESVSEAAFDSQQVRTLAETELNMLAGLAIPTVFKFLFPKMYLLIWQLLTQAALASRKFIQIALGIPRGFAKTTVVKLFILFCILFTKKKFILIVCSTEGHAVNIISDVMDMLNERNIQKLFGDWKLGIETDKQELKKFGYRGRSIVLAGIGQGGSVRGFNLKNERPDIMIFDDIQTAECAESKLQSDALERWMIGTAMKAKSPHGCLFIFAGNMYRTPYSILKKLKTNPTWTKFISGAITQDGVSIWEELRSLESLLDELDSDIAAGHPEIFFAEVLNDVDAGYNTKVDYALIRDWKWGEHEQPQGKAVIVDPSTNKRGGDDVAIGYMEVYDATPAMREVIEEKLSPGNTIRRALLMALRHNCKVIAIESNAYQYSLLYWCDEISKQLGITGIHFVELYSGSYSKNSRITDMLKGLTSGEIIIHPSIKSLVTKQIADWNPLKRDNTDNLLDLLCYAPRVIELYGELIMTDTNLEVMEASAAQVQENNHAF